MLGHLKVICKESKKEYLLTFSGEPSPWYNYGEDADGNRGEPRQDPPEDPVFEECDPPTIEPLDALEVGKAIEEPSLEDIEWDWES